jgi:hypothetical protein
MTRSARLKTMHRALVAAGYLVIGVLGCGGEAERSPAASTTAQQAPNRTESVGRATIDGQPFTALASESACMLMGSEGSAAPQFVFTIADATTQIQFRTPAVSRPAPVQPHGVLVMKSDAPFSQVLSSGLQLTAIERSADGYLVSGTFAFEIREMEMMGFTASGEPATTMQIADGEFRRVECLSAAGFTFPDLP